MRKAGNSEPVDAKLDVPNQFGGRSGYLWKSSRISRLDHGRRIRERQSSFTETPAKPLVELFQRQFPGVRIGAPAPDFLDLLIGQPVDAFVLRFH
jgi:hypothetical protein